MPNYKYEVLGTANQGQTWSCTGRIRHETADIGETADKVVMETFMGLTNGKAVFGKPGLGCEGLYKITKFLLEVIVESPLQER